jgi:uncharacterized protein YggU (UPF0235/DUF167 family)
VSSRVLRIVAGHTSSNKVVEVEGLSQQDAERTLASETERA